MTTVECAWNGNERENRNKISFDKKRNIKKKTLSRRAVPVCDDVVSSRRVLAVWKQNAIILCELYLQFDYWRRTLGVRCFWKHEVFTGSRRRRKYMTRTSDATRMMFWMSRHPLLTIFLLVSDLIFLKLLLLKQFTKIHFWGLSQIITIL